MKSSEPFWEIHVFKNLKTMPPTVELPGYVGRWLELDGLHFAYEECAAGSNIDSLIAIYDDRACPVAHWGYLFSGRVRVEFTDGHEEIYEPGTLFQIPPGHRPYMLEDTVLLQITRLEDHHRMIAEMSAAGVLG